MKPASLVPGDKVRIFSPITQRDREAYFVKSAGSVYYFDVPELAGCCGVGKSGLLSMSESNVLRYVRVHKGQQAA
ncbi:MAG: hypothetical protein LBR05_10285 [Azoarcus sp.]|jgi:hypothetical protein|nr:hypothetical protein [Azoarcus sp.]